MTASGDNGFIC